jgi:PPOX class probable F420-dependent enzyme
MDERIARLLDTVRVATLATVSPDGRPHLVPVVFARDAGELVTAVDGKFKSGKTLARIDNINHDPRVSLLVHHYDEDWSRLWWVRIDGRASLETSGAAFEGALAALRDRYPQYGSVDLGGPVIRVLVDRTTSWDASPK